MTGKGIYFLKIYIYVGIWNIKQIISANLKLIDLISGFGNKIYIFKIVYYLFIYLNLTIVILVFSSSSINCRLISIIFDFEKIKQ